MRKCLLFICIVCLTLVVQAQDTLQSNALPVKTGVKFGALPAVSYSSDLGFQYGLLTGIYFYGDGKVYPKYLHYVYAEVSRFTKGSGVNRLFYDSEHLIPGLRLTADFSYLTEQALDFYGFNGYMSKYNPEWTNEDDPAYKSRMAYNHERKMLRVLADVQGSIIGRKLRWLAGFGVIDMKIASVDVKKLNKGKADKDTLPSVATEPGLYEKYLEWGIISPDEKDGGKSNFLKLGLVYDTRDFEPNPMRGVWTEALVTMAPRFASNGNFGHSKFAITHRQYFTLMPNTLSFAYRASCQGLLGGTMPFYMAPYLNSSFLTSWQNDGLGGSKTLRGMMRNRVVGKTVAFGNAEIRWKFMRFNIKTTNFYLALNAFADMGQVIDPLKIDKSKVSDTDKASYFDQDKDGLHTTYGGGLRIVKDESFIVAIDYGRVVDKRDGTQGIYIGLNYLF